MTIGERLTLVRETIEKAKKQPGSVDGSGELIAVSKTRSVDDVIDALSHQQIHFGENRVQEAQQKFPQLRKDNPSLVLHLIGPLQSNKVKDAVALFDVIQTVDRPKIARALAKEMEIQEKSLKLFVQVNVGEEPQKAGVAPQDLDEFISFCREDCKLTIEGLMCIPPQGEEPSPYFVMLRQLAEAFGPLKLSMGMSSDFETAIAFGADYVRVGTAIFGERV